MNQNILKQGAVLTYQVLQNTTNYQLRLSNTGKGLWVCIQQSNSIWKLTITSELVDQTVAKASSTKQSIIFKDFMSILVQALSKSSQRWTLGIMTPIQLEVMRGGSASKQANNTKIYMILSDKQKKLHYPFTLNMGDMNEKEKLCEAIRVMKAQLQQLKAQTNDKSQSSFSILSQTLNINEQMKLQNDQMKKRIKIYEESLTQKRGAVEIDVILKEKNNLQLQALAKKRQQAKEIAKYRNIYQMVERQNNQINNQIELINREIIMLQDSVGNSTKLKSHALKVIKTYENQLRTQKKVLQKQIKEIDNLKKNVLNSKNNQRKVLGKIKQIQTQIDQSKKKANIKQISNRLHSVGKSKGSGDSPSNKSQSIASSNQKPVSQTSSKGPTNTNIVRDNLLKKNMPKTSYNRANLLQTSPNIKLTQTNSSKEKSNQKIVARAINTSYQVPKYTSSTNSKLFNTQKYGNGSKSQNQDSIKSQSVGKKETSKQQKQKQKRAMDRLTQNNRPNIMKAPSLPKQSGVKGALIPRGNSQKNISSSLNKGNMIKKQNPKDLLQKMKDIKAQYNNRTSNLNSNTKNVVNKVNQLTGKLK